MGGLGRGKKKGDRPGPAMDHGRTGAILN